MDGNQTIEYTVQIKIYGKNKESRMCKNPILKYPELELPESRTFTPTWITVHYS